MFTGLTLHRVQPLSKMPLVRLSTSISRLMRRHSHARRHRCSRVNLRQRLTTTRRASRCNSRSSLFISSRFNNPLLSINRFNINRFNNRFSINPYLSSLCTSSPLRRNRLHRTVSRSTARRNRHLSRCSSQSLLLKNRSLRLNRRSAKKR